MKLFLLICLLINLVTSDQTVRLSNCMTCNNEICIYNVNASTEFINFKSCQCIDKTKCGLNCFQHNYSKNEITSCMDKGIFCNDIKIRNVYSFDSFITVGFLFFIIMVINGSLSLIIIFFITFNNPQRTREVFYMSLNNSGNANDPICLGDVKNNRLFLLCLIITIKSPKGAFYVNPPQHSALCAVMLRRITMDVDVDINN